MSNNEWIELDHEFIKCRIKRIDDDCYCTLGVHSLAINECYEFWRNYLNCSDNENLKAAPLAFFLASFERAYGPSGTIYDSYKGAFSFPFAVKFCSMIPRLLIFSMLHVGVARSSSAFGKLSQSMKRDTIRVSYINHSIMNYPNGKCICSPIF